MIVSGDIEKLTDNNTLILLLEVYCLINNIEIKQSEENNIYYDDDLKLTDSIKIYLREIGEYPLLSIEQQRDLALKILEGDNKARERISKDYKLPYYTAIHPTSTIGLEVKIQEGTVVAANATINVNSSIGKHCIINTGAIIEHDNEIEDFVHVSPNATIAGTVKIGKKTHIGIGASVKNNIYICEDSIIGAGAVVINNIEIKGTYVGVPAKKIN